MKIQMILNKPVVGLVTFHISRVSQKSLCLNWGEAYTDVEKQIIVAIFETSCWCSKLLNVDRMERCVGLKK